MFNVLFKNQIKLILQQSLYWGSALFVVACAVVLYHLYFVDQASNFWAGEISPPARYLVIYLGGIPLVLMMLISCFLSTRTLARASQYRIEEVLLTKPYGNLIHALSSTLASTLLCALPIIGFTVGVSVVAITQGWFNTDFAEPFEFVSMNVFLVFTTIVSLYFVSVLSYYVYYRVRVTLLSVLASAAFVSLVIYLLTRVSFNQFVFFEFLPLVGDVSSEMIADKLNTLDYLRFLAFVCLCATLTVGATWLESRRDMQEKLRTLLGGCFGAITCACFAILLLSWFNHASDVKKWQQHVITVKSVITLDLKEISGSVIVTPGKGLEANITVTGVSTVNIKVEDDLVLWLNPGFKVHSVQMHDSDVRFELDAGKLSVSLNRELALGESVQLDVKYRGKPNTLYGYHDSALDVANMPYWDQLISYYGMSPGIFDQKYVALPQTTHWLPTSALQSVQGTGSIDFINAELTISVPSNWVATMTGSVAVQEIDAINDQTRTVQFTSQQPLAGINLYASDMTKHTVYLEPINVTLELYLPDRHFRSLQDNQEYEKYLQAFKTWFIEEIEEAQQLGYSFPCDTYRFVAVPSDFRVYGGGIFLDSLITAPCTYLFREHGALALNVGPRVMFLGEDFDYTPMYRTDLEGYFATRHNGGNLALDLAKHFFEFQIGLLGSEGKFLKKVLSYLHDHTWSKGPLNPSPYTPSVFFPREMKVKRMTPKAEFLAGIHHMPMDENTLQIILRSEVTLQKILTNYVKRYTRHIDQTDIVFEHFLESDAVVDIAVHNSLRTLADLEPNALVQEAIRLRCIALADKIFALLGREKSRVLLQEISNRFQYENISVSDVFDTAASLDLPVREIMAGWYEQTEQFNFSFSPPTVSKFINPDTQEAYYQVQFAIANTGATAGVFHTNLRVARESTESVSSTDTAEKRRVGFLNLNNAVNAPGPSILIAAGETREVGLVTSTRPYRVNLKSYDVSYVNENNMLVRSDPLVKDMVEQVPFEGTRPSSWVPKLIHGIVVDDVDLAVQPVEDGVITYDKEWERFDFGGAWGNGRKSFIFTENLKVAEVNLEAELPSADYWRIEIHVPDIRGTHSIGHRKRRMMATSRVYFKGSFGGAYKLTIANGNPEENIEFEVVDSDYGWLQIGNVELAGGQVDISIVPIQGTGQLFFDAIRLVQSGRD